LSRALGWWAYNNGGYAHGDPAVPLNYPTNVDATTVCQSPGQFDPWNFNTSFGFNSYHTGGVNFALVDVAFPQTMYQP